MDPYPSTAIAPAAPPTRIHRLPVRLPRRFAIAPADRPELPMHVEFEGLTPEEQRRALAGFPAGRRFVLAR